MACGGVYPLQDKDFQGLNAMVPNDISLILDLSFGDWLRLPKDAYSHFHSNYFGFGDNDKELDEYLKKENYE